MAISDILKPQQAPGSNLGALGMADGPLLHCRCMNFITNGINAHLMNIGTNDIYEAWTEGPSEAAAKDYYRYDVVMKANVDIENNTSDNILVVEVCHNGDFEHSKQKAKNRNLYF